MNEAKSNYLRGLLYFCCLMVCVCMWFVTPDGDTILYKILGLFGISSEIPLWTGGTLYIYMLMPLTAGIVCAGKILRYWGYPGSIFRKGNFLPRFIPLLILIPVLLFSNTGILSPPVIDRVYYAVTGQRDGLQSIVFYSDDDNAMRYSHTGNDWTFTYDLTFANCGGDILEFSVKLTSNTRYLHDVFIKDESGKTKVFTIEPKQVITISGELAEHIENTSGSGGGIYSLSIINEDEQHSPKPLVKHPIM